MFLLRIEVIKTILDFQLTEVCHLQKRNQFVVIKQNADQSQSPQESILGPLLFSALSFEDHFLPLSEKLRHCP